MSLGKMHFSTAGGWSWPATHGVLLPPVLSRCYYSGTAKLSAPFANFADLNPPLAALSSRIYTIHASVPIPGGGSQCVKWIFAYGPTFRGNPFATVRPRLHGLHVSCVLLGSLFNWRAPLLQMPPPGENANAWVLRSMAVGFQESGLFAFVSEGVQVQLSWLAVDVSMQCNRLPPWCCCN